MDPNQAHESDWQLMAAAINRLSPEDRRLFFQALRTFAHDLRQTIGQVQSAEGLLRPLMAGDPDPQAIPELLDVIRTANARAGEVLAEFVDHFIEEIDRS